MINTTIRFRRSIAWLVMAAMTLTQSAQVYALTLATSPLAATTTSVVRPNIMYVLDDSGSMAWDFTPDYINDSTVATDPGSLGGSNGDGIRATISGGSITSIVASAPPFNTFYSSSPAIVIQGGGGTGAVATANMCTPVATCTPVFPATIKSITVNSGGTGYTSVPFTVTVGHLGHVLGHHGRQQFGWCAERHGAVAELQCQLAAALCGVADQLSVLRCFGAICPAIECG